MRKSLASIFCKLDNDKHNFPNNKIILRKKVSKAIYDIDRTRPRYTIELIYVRLRIVYIYSKSYLPLNLYFLTKKIGDL